MTYEYFATREEAEARVDFHHSRNRCAYLLVHSPSGFEVRSWY